MLANSNFEILLDLPSEPEPDKFYQIQGTDSTQLYYVDSKGNVNLLNNTEYSDEKAQDAVADILNSSSTISFSYDDSIPSITASVLNNSITFTKLQDITSSKLLGRSAAGTGDVEEIVVGSGLSLSSGTLSATVTSAYTDEQAQDAVGTILVDTATIDFTYTDATPEIKADVINNSITYAKLQTIAANSVIGNSSGSVATPFAVSVLPTATANSISLRDANANVFANNFLSNYISTATAGGTTALTDASARIQNFTGSTTQTVRLPSVAILALGHVFEITNYSSGIITVQSSGSNTIQTMATNSRLIVVSNATSGTNASVWNSTYIPILTNVENTALSTWAGSINITTLGTISTGTWNGGIIGKAYGGTAVDNSTGGTANQFWARPDGATGAAAYRAIVAADIPILNQNTTGSAATLTTTRTIGGSNFNGSANITSFPTPGAIGGTTSSAGTFTVLTGTSGSITGLTTLAIRDTSAAFDVTIAATSSTALTTGRTLTFDLVNAARTLKLMGNPTIADWFDQSVKSGASPTFVTVTAALSGNATTATTLATSRAIYGNNFDGSAALAQIIASTYGGTGNGFTKFSGPTTSEKTFTLPNASATILTSNAAVTVPQGAMGWTTVATGRIPYASATDTINTSANLVYDGTEFALINSSSGGVYGLSIAPSNGAYTAKTRLGSNYNVGYFNQNAYYNGSAWIADNTGLASCSIQMVTASGDSYISFFATATNNAPPGTEIARFDASATGGNTRFMVWDVTAGSLKRVSVGANDSGGTGFKVLRVVN